MRSFEWFYLDRLCHRDLFTLKGGSNGVSRVTYSPDGKRLATASRDGMVRLWDAMTGQETLTLKGHTNGVFGLAFSPDGKRLASASADPDPRNGNKWGHVKIWDASNGKEELPLKGLTGGYYRVAFNPDGTRLATASYDRTAGVWDAITGQELLIFKGHTDPLYWAAFSPDGKSLASAGGYGNADPRPRELKVWDATTGHVISVQ